MGRRATISCSVSGLQIDINQSGSSVSATATGGASDGDDPSFNSSGESEEEQIRGTVDGTSVRFTVEPDGFIRLSYSGSVDGNSMSGTVRGSGLNHFKSSRSCPKGRHEPSVVARPYPTPRSVKT